MALFLVQHGKALSQEIDPERGLSEEGISEVERIANTAKNYKVIVSAIKHSGKKRAKQTADIFAAVLKPVDGVSVIAGLNPLDDVAPISHSTFVNENVMLVGHLPFMEKLTSYLIIGQSEPPVFKFQNGGIVCLDQDADGKSWVIKWALMPNIS